MAKYDLFSTQRRIQIRPCNLTVQLSCNHQVDTVEVWDKREGLEGWFVPRGLYCARCNRTQTVVTEIERSIDAESTYAHIEQKEKSMTLDVEIQYHKERVRELERRAAQASRFGSDEDYGTDSVIFFKRSFGRDTSRWKVFTGYTYAAVKASNGVWYVTGNQGGSYSTYSNGRPRAWSFVELVEEHLVPAAEEDMEIWFAKTWVAL